MWSASLHTGVILTVAPVVNFQNGTGSRGVKGNQRDAAKAAGISPEEKQASHITMLNMVNVLDWPASILESQVKVCMQYPRILHSNLPPDQLARVLRAFASRTLAEHSNVKKIGGGVAPIELLLPQLTDAVSRGVDEDKLSIDGGIPGLMAAMDKGMGDFHVLGSLLVALTNDCKTKRKMWTFKAMQEMPGNDYKKFTASCGSFAWESANCKAKTEAALQRVLSMVTDAINVGDAIDRDEERATDMRSSSAVLILAYENLVPEKLSIEMKALKAALAIEHRGALHKRWRAALFQCVAKIFGEPPPPDPNNRQPPSVDIPRTMLKVVQWAIGTVAHLKPPESEGVTQKARVLNPVNPWAVKFVQHEMKNEMKKRRGHIDGTHGEAD
jgi:hypothetical protein